MDIVALAGGVVALLTVADLVAANVAEMGCCIVRPEGERELLILAIVAGLT